MKCFLNRFCPSLIVIFFLSMTNCTNKPSYETCGDKSICSISPAAENAPESVKKLRTEVAGKWKLADLQTENTALKTKQSFNNLRFSMCISYNGGIQFFRNGQDYVCDYCYELKSTNDTLTINIDEANLSAFCKQQFQTSAITIRNDSMILFRRDSTVEKRIVYRRTDDNWNYKIN